MLNLLEHTLVRDGSHVQGRDALNGVSSRWFLRRFLKVFLVDKLTVAGEVA